MSDEGKEPAEDRNEWWKQMEYRHLDGGPYQMYPRTGGAPVYEWERVGEPVALTGKGKTSARKPGRRGTSPETDRNAREAQRLYREQDLTQAQIAERLSVSISTAKRYLKRKLPEQIE